jgi:hypothetical membrane protein
MNKVHSGEISTDERRKELYVRCLGAVGAASATAFVSVLAALLVLRPDVSFIGNYVSEYANGPYGLLFRAAALVHGIGNMAITLGLWALAARSRSGRWGAGLFGAATVAIVIAALFPTDPLDVPRTLSGTVHLVAAFSSFALEAAALLFLAPLFRRHDRWRSFVPVTVSLAVIGGAFVVLLLALRAGGGSPGLVERAALAAFVAWEILAAVRLAKSGRQFTQMAG